MKGKRQERRSFISSPRWGTLSSTYRKGCGEIPACRKDGRNMVREDENKSSTL